MIQLDHSEAGSGPALLGLGFRLFFLGAAVFAVASIVAWTLVYTFGAPLQFRAISSFQWHAHEMIYGYSLAVIAGFLLTAVRNWTGMQTLHGPRLLAVFCLWAAARVALFFGTLLIYPAAVLDTLFAFALIAATAYPIVRTRKWRHLIILSNVVLIGAGNVSFYLGAAGWLDSGIYWGIYGGLYLVVGLILVMGRRVIPFFIERGVGYPVTLFNSKWIDVSILALFVALFIVELFATNKWPTPLLAAVLFAINVFRLAGWHTRGIWRKPLLWSLYLAYAAIVAGFLLLALGAFAGVSRFVAIHSFTYGGIGLLTMSMMARVSLGHTGRDVQEPPAALWYCFVILVVGTVFRVLLPLTVPQFYVAWIGISQLLWIAAFAGLAVVLLPILISPRVDGRPG